jgi:hypothetical protein
MFIKPKGLDNPIMDELTRNTIELFEKCIPDHSSATKGVHLCTGCREMSNNINYTTPKGRVTNSLLVHYVERHRNEIPKEELEKLKDELIEGIASKSIHVLTGKSNYRK